MSTPEQGMVTYRELVALQEENERLLELIRQCVEGLNCQPGYVRSQTLTAMSAILAERAALAEGKGEPK